MTTIDVPLLAPSLNGSKGLIRMHHHAYKRERERWVMEILAATLPRDRRDHSPCHVTITRFYCPHPLDYDNLYASAKLPLDALRHAGLLADDDPDCVLGLVMHQVRVKSRKDVSTHIALHARPQRL